MLNKNKEHQMGALYALVLHVLRRRFANPSRCGWRIVVETASEMINSAKITQKVSTLLPPQDLLSQRFDGNFKLKHGAHPGVYK